MPSFLVSLSQWAKRAKAPLARFRIPILILAAIAFVIGMIWSISALGLKWSDVALAPIALLALVIAPLSVAYSAVNMQLMGKAIGTKIGFLYGAQISAFAQIAELLPIPGGAIVRTAALMKSGGKTGNSAGLVVAFALLWIACAAAGCGLALLHISPAAYAPLIGGVTLIAGIVLWLGTSFGWAIAISALFLRILGLSIVSLRVIVAFAVIGIAVGAQDALAFAFALILGSAASIVPAGLGIGEGLSALMAGAVEVDPAAAFIAAAIGRLVGLAVNMCAALWFSTFPMHSASISDPKQ
ncbi:MAG: hypothetical protein ABJP34_12870 [Erythrobacter sp.]